MDSRCHVTDSNVATKRQTTFIVCGLVATSLSVTWHLDSMRWAVVAIRGRSFPFVSGRLCPWAVVFVAGSRLSLSAVAVIRLRLWAVVCVLGQSFAFLGGRFHWGLSLVMAQCGGCRRWRRYAVVVVTNMVVGGGKKRVAVFVKYDAKQTLFVVCYK